MNRKELDLLSMIESVSEGLETNLSLISDKPAIMEIHLKLKGNIVEIYLLKRKQAVSPKSSYAIKSNNREDLIANILNVSAGVGAVGAEKNDVKLKLVGAITEPALNKMRESDLVLKGHEVYEAAATIVTELMAWKVTKEEIDELGEMTDSYLSQNPTIRNAKSKVRQATTEIGEKLEESYSLIKDPLDALMLPFKKINPTFYGEYLNNRRIVTHAATHSKSETKTDTEEKQ